MSDNIHNPSHYTAYPVQPIELSRNLGFCMGNVVKYVLRAPFKNGAEDLHKALKYLQWEAEQHETSRFAHSLTKETFNRFFDALGVVSGKSSDDFIFSIEGDVIPEAYALDCVNFLNEMYMYLFVPEDHAESGLVTMEIYICQMVDTMEQLTSGTTFDKRRQGQTGE